MSGNQEAFQKAIKVGHSARLGPDVGSRRHLTARLWMNFPSIPPHFLTWGWRCLK